jgi:hypothetical protein
MNSTSLRHPSHKYIIFDASDLVVLTTELPCESMLRSVLLPLSVAVSRSSLCSIIIIDIPRFVRPRCSSFLLRFLIIDGLAYW